MGIHRRAFLKISSLTTANLAVLRLAGGAGILSPVIHPDKFDLTGASAELRSVLLINSVPGGRVDSMPRGPEFLSPEWNTLFRHALTEADRLGIEVGVNLCSGWCMGGPWIKPEHSGRWFLQSELKVTGPRKFAGKLPLPGSRDGYDKVFNPPGYKSYIDLPLSELDYRDTNVVAFHLTKEEGTRFDTERAKLIPAKTNRKDSGNWTPANLIVSPPLTRWNTLPEDNPIPVSDVIDLTSKVTDEGYLDWNVPEGEWIIVRTGHRMTGSRVSLAVPEASGLSVDWFSASAVEQQFNALGNKLLKEAGTSVGKSLKYFHDDSFEDGFPNWTDNILQEFKQRRGYDAAPYLPVFTGRIIGGAEISDRFLYDYRKTVTDCMADIAFCEGINRIVIHTSTASRPGDGKPGYEYEAGTHFNPNVTWWDKPEGFFSYIGRCQHLLQSGKFVADVLYYNGDWAPNLVDPKHVDPSLGKGYDCDVCNEEVLLERLSVKDGRLVLPDGMHYRLPVLSDTERMPVPVVYKIRELAKAGATIVGPKPGQDPGLKNFPQCDDEVRDIADEVWGDCDGKRVKEHRFGKERVVWGITLRALLLQDGIKPDFEYSGDEETYIDFIHRSADDTEMYFIANRNNREENTDCSFRIAGRQPEIWNPVSGEMYDAGSFRQEGSQTVMPMKFLPHQSFFVVFKKMGWFHKAIKPEKGKRNFVKFTPVQPITGAWRVKFDTAWGGPEEITFVGLEDWSQRPEKGIRYFSGTATYIKQFDVAEPLSGGNKLFLNLGMVKNLAEVRLNGKALGIVWTEPWQVDITEAVKQKGNKLEIEVVNLWPNRLIGDAALPAEERLTHTNIPFKKDMPLLPSGLLGPVTVLKTVTS